MAAEWGRGAGFALLVQRVNRVVASSFPTVALSLNWS